MEEETSLEGLAISVAAVGAAGAAELGLLGLLCLGGNTVWVFDELGLASFDNLSPPILCDLRTLRTAPDLEVPDRSGEGKESTNETLLLDLGLPSAVTGPFAVIKGSQAPPTVTVAAGKEGRVAMVPFGAIRELSPSPSVPQTGLIERFWCLPGGWPQMGLQHDILPELLPLATNWEQPHWLQHPRFTPRRSVLLLSSG